MGSQSKYGANFLNATKLGAIFLILNIPFMTVQNLLSELQKNNGFGALGFWLLAVFYLFQMLGSVISAAVFDKIGMKSTFFLGGIFLSLVVLCQIVPAERSQIKHDPDNNPSGFLKFVTQDHICIMICYMGSIFGGFGQSLVWVAQGEYMSSCGTDETAGFYFGYFWVWYMSTNIIGNWLGSEMIQRESGPAFFFIMFLIMIAGNAGFLFLKKPHQDLNKTLDSKFEGLKSLEDQTEALITAPIDANYQNQQRQISDSLHEGSKETFLDVVKSTVRLCFSKKMMYMNLQLCWTGGSIAYWSSILTPVMALQLKADDPDMEDNIIDSWALFGLIAFGFGDVIGGALNGWILDKIGSQKGALLNVALIIAVMLVTILSIVSMSYNWLTYLMCFIWGIQDGAINIHTYRVLGTEFKSKSEPFSVFNLVQGLSVFCFQGVEGAINSDDKMTLIYYTIAACVFGVLSCLVTYFMPFNELNKSTRNLQNQIDIQNSTSDIVSTSSLQLSPLGSQEKSRDFKLNQTENTSRYTSSKDVAAPDSN